jgi:hypothetical protein
MTWQDGRYTPNTGIQGWGASTMRDPIYPYIFGALILIAAFAPIAFLIFDKAGL